MEWYNLLYILLHISQIHSDLDMVILHSNDIRGQYSSFQYGSSSTVCEVKQSFEGTCVGGVPRIRYTVEKFRQDAQLGKGPLALFLFAGNIFGDTIWHRLHKWNISADFMNLLKPDAVALGIEDFSLRLEGLIRYVDELKVPVVAANLHVSDVPPLKKIQPYVILNVKNTQIGIIGYISTRAAAFPIGSFNPGIKISDPVEAVRTQSKYLSDLGVRIIIALGSDCYETDRAIAKEVENVDIVIGGNERILFYNGNIPVDVKHAEQGYPRRFKHDDDDEVLVVQAGEKTIFLGCLFVSFESKGRLMRFHGQPIYLSSTVPKDPDALTLLEKYQKDVDASSVDQFGYSTTVIQGDRRICSKKECTLGNLLTDALVSYIARFHPKGAKSWSYAAIGMIVGKTSKQDIKPDIITLKKIVEALPYDNEVRVCTLPGDVLYATLENSVINADNIHISEYFLQYSGIRVRYDIGRAASNRVLSAKVRCNDCAVPEYRPLNKSESYNIVSNDFLMSGPPVHKILAPYGPGCNSLHITDTEVVKWYINKFSPIFPEEDDRIEILNLTRGCAPARTVFCIYYLVCVYIIIL